MKPEQKPGARQAALGLPRVHRRLTDSTNERARELAAAGAPHGTLVTAEEQTLGRGRQGRAWIAAPGRALLMSVVVRGLAERDALLPLAAAVAACEGCEAVTPVRCSIKWPNDVWIDGRKVAGILVESRPRDRWAVVGIGVNVATQAYEFPPELRETATSLALATYEGQAPATGGAQARAAVESLLRAILEALGNRLGDSAEDVLGAWRGRDALLGRRVHWDGGEGLGAGIDDAGALLVETAGGRGTLDAGEVHLAR